MKAPLVVVGPCASGKSTLVECLRREGIPARSVAQEHSAVPDLFAQRPGSGVIYLSAQWPTAHRRRPQSLGYPQYAEEMRRLQAARQAADLVVHTDGLLPAEVCRFVKTWWASRQLTPIS